MREEGWLSFQWENRSDYNGEWLNTIIIFNGLVLENTNQGFDVSI